MKVNINLILDPYSYITYIYTQRDTHIVGVISFRGFLHLSNKVRKR